MRVLVRQFVTPPALIALLSLGLTSCFNKDGLDTARQMELDMETIDQYIALNNINAYVDKSGVRFSIDQIGTGGFPPRTDQNVKVKYTGKFLDGTVFDPGGDISGVLNTFIYGWRYGLSVWPVGTKGTLYVPSPLGYGSAPYNTIPANSILVFTIELKAVTPTNAEKARLAADIVAIDNFLESNNIDAVKDTTGIRYIINTPGEGPIPSWYTKVKFNYRGKAMNSGAEFFNGSSAPTDVYDSRVVDFINGIRFGLSKIAPGGKITLYIPSGLAFGPDGNSQNSLPANSNVIYELELTEVVN